MFEPVHDIGGKRGKTQGLWWGKAWKHGARDVSATRSPASPRSRQRPLKSDDRRVGRLLVALNDPPALPSPHTQTEANMFLSPELLERGKWGVAHAACPATHRLQRSGSTRVHPSSHGFSSQQPHDRQWGSGHGHRSSGRRSSEVSSCIRSSRISISNSRGSYSSALMSNSSAATTPAVTRLQPKTTGSDAATCASRDEVCTLRRAGCGAGTLPGCPPARPRSAS